ncbi:uncharacterized protein LOC131693281 [Topomyia yanbarensis]|uniref:uncharacterized protein LOC131693281 n=1 Tax=Topomyia yanbarensis TaxID=2498891 RepID=UPI00273CA72D|nr:uncharacterized protein LOC131693281 [Topomyia yanbarensis]
MDRLVLVSIVAAVLCLSWSTVQAQLDGNNYRLPNNSYPLRYDLELTTYIHEDGSDRQFRFDGRVKMQIFVKDERNSTITVHYRLITITHVKLWSFFGNGTENVLLNDNSSFTLDPVREFVTVTPPGVDLKGTYFLEFEYNGELREDNAGFYRSSYVDDEGKIRWLATTQFSSTDARHAFPCYDEPGIRAPIELTVIHGEQYTVLSNNLPLSSEPGPIEGYVKTVFNDTPVMQPYLLGIIVSDFVSVSSELYPRQSIFARYNAIRNGEGDFILEAGYKILNVLEQFLETNYALPKIYQVAVPDFAAGAMENYGLVTYKEENFFYNEHSSPMKQKHAIATVVGHEFGHQYFGNMVSPSWWSYLWMKEGFARYFEYLASDLAYPELRIGETYSVQKMQNAFDLDSLGSSRPMTYYVNTQSEIANIFDNIAYDKGGSIMRMFQHAFGLENFRQALIGYLRVKAFQGAQPKDFADAIQKAIDNASDIALPVNITALDILKSWTEQSGYPVLHVSRSLDLRIHLTQERYLLKSIDTTGSTWILPYNFATTKHPNFATTSNTRWLITSSITLPAEDWASSDWIIFNKQQTGYYRVNYDERLWNLITTQLHRNVSTIDNMNRAQLIDDSMNLARSGRLGYDTALRLISYLTHERDYVPWAAANRNLAVLMRLFSGSSQLHLLKRYLLSVINPVFVDLGLETQPNDDLFTRQARELAATWACSLCSEECLNTTAEIVMKSVGSSNIPVDPDLRGVIYCHGIKKADREVFLEVWSRMQTSQDQLFRTDLIHALGCTQNNELKLLLLNTSIADDAESLKYFGQERERIFTAVYSNDKKGTEIALQFFADNIWKINELYNKGNFGGRAIGAAITGLAKFIVDNELNTQFQQLIDQLSKAGLLRDTDILRALEQSSENLQWVETKGREIEEWLQAFYPAPTTEEPTTITETETTETQTTSTTTTTSITPSTSTTSAPTKTTTITTTTTTVAASSTVTTTHQAESTATTAPTSTASITELETTSTTVTSNVETTTEHDDGASGTLLSISALVFSVLVSSIIKISAATEGRNQLLCNCLSTKMWKKLSLLVLFLVNYAFSGVPLLNRQLTATTRHDTIEYGYRLPNTTLPLKYDIELTTHVHDNTNPNQFDFEGKVLISLQILEENITNITLHYRQTTITHVKLSEANGTVIIDDDSSFSTIEDLEFLVINAPVALNPVVHLLEIEYHGVLRTDNGGFYRSSYTNANGDTRWIATTQFESTDARHAFPCYDEPSIRAPISLKLTHGSTYYAISNMPIKSISVIANYTTTEFHETLSMQTYLLAFVVSDFDNVSDYNNDQSVYAIPTAIANGDLDFALQTGVKIIHALEDFLQVNYSFPKLDQIAIPDFAAGAMENWGLVTYREEILLYNSSKSPMSQLKRTAAIIAHEYGHQFFGNLVSPAWWSYLWLNEGFATLLEYLASDKVYPELHIQDMFNIEAVQTAFQSDALESTRAMNSYVETPVAISELFDDIAYQKSGSVLRQLQHAFGDSVFRTGLKYYLEEKQFQSATPDDLAFGLQRAVEETNALSPEITVLNILNSWANQEGYPVLHINRDTTGVINIRQERYLLKNSEQGTNMTWYVPYNVATRQDDDFSSTLPLNWLVGDADEIRPTTSLNWNNDDWVIFNKQQTGYYRVNYDDNLWHLISQELRQGNHTVIHHLNRAQLIDDSLNLARSGHIKYDIALQLIQYLAHEAEYIPWASANNGLTYLNRMLSGSSKYDLFKKYVWNIIESPFHKLGLSNKAIESHFDKLTRNILVNWACLVDSDECLAQTSALLSDVVSNITNDVDPNLKGVVYCNGLRNADRDTFLYVWDRMQKSQDPAERSLLTTALGCSQNAELLTVFLETSLDETGDANYRGQERARVFSSVYTNGKVGLETGIKFLAENAQTIDRLYNGGSFGGRAIGAAITGMARRIVTKEQNDEFEALIAKLVADDYLNEGEIATARELSNENIIWANKNFGIIESWLNKNVRSSAMALSISLVVLSTTFTINLLFCTKKAVPNQFSRESRTIRMIALNSVFLCGLALAASIVAAERPLSKMADVEPPLIAPEMVEQNGDFAPFQDVDDSYRLPKTSIPTHYEVQLSTEIHTGNRNFGGSVLIHLTVLEATNDIVVHHRGLVVQTAKLVSVPSAGGNPVQLNDPQWTYDSRVEQLTFTSDSLLNPGNYQLTITFNGRLSNNEDGFYISSYTDDTGSTKYLATTQFESTSARMAFPCYDEPDLKATFVIRIIHHNSYSARSNMKFTTQSAGDLTVTTFSTTPVMSTYLLAFVVSDFVSLGDERHSVYARPNAIDEVQFAVEAGNKILGVLNTHIGIDYYDHMPEMKQFAIPDFAAGAMENWGLVTYREQYLLFNPALSTYRTKTNIATVIAHEYAHQWFGNLVSPQWWEYIWLNEGFATLYEYYAAHLAYPSEQYWELFNPQVIQAAMVPDGLDSTRPMTWNAATPTEIARLFDRVAYPKSGSVLNMMRHVLGEENWTAGLKNYLLERQFKGANVEHLHTGLQAAIEGKNILPTGVTIKQIMDSWTTEKGYPVISVRRSYDSGDIIISQERFISDRKVPNTNVWMIPYNYVLQSAANFDDLHSYDWLSTKAARLKANVPDNEWIIFNKQQVGFYRVNYDTKNWELIIDALNKNHESIHRLNRAQLIDDAYWLARSGRLDFEIVMNLITYMKNEKDYAPWAAANNVLSYFNSKLRGTPAYDDFLVMVRNLIGNVYSTLTIDSVSNTETLLHKYLKQTISTWACIAGDTSCLERTKDALTNEAVKGTMVHPDIASVVYCYGLRDAGETEFVYLYKRIYPTQNWAFRTMIIDSLGCSQNKDFLKAFLETAIGGSGAGVEINYKSSERTRIVQSVYSGGRAGIEALTEFLMDPNMLNDFISKLGINTLNNAISNIASRTSTEQELEQLNALLTSLGLYISQETAAAALATVQTNMDWHGSYEGMLTTNFINEYAESVDQDTTLTTGEVTTTTPGTTTTSDVTTTTAQTTTADPGGAATIAVSVTLLFATILISLLK